MNATPQSQKRLFDVIRASRPVLFRNYIEGYEYSLTGTSFLCEFESDQFIVTAKHVLSGFDPESICIPFHYESREFLPYTCVCTPAGNDPEEVDRFDIAVLPIAKNFNDTDLLGQGPFRLSLETIDQALEPGTHLVLRGFPDSTNKIDYEQQSITLEGTAFGATILGRSIIKGCIEIAFNDLTECRSINGLSGSPVFSIDTLAPPYHVRLAGMLLRGTKSSGRGHMLHPRSILAMLKASAAQTIL
jgi:hypothetical protein